MAKRIFIIDDQPDTMLAADALLRENGYLVGSETNPVEGLKRVRADIPDLLLLDIQMPEMDGFEVCKALKTDPQTKHLPIIMLSVQAQEAHVIAGLELGADDYLQKPFRKHELLARIKVVLRRLESFDPVPALRLGPLEINTEMYIAAIDGQPLKLEPKEFQLLEFFAKREGRILTRAAISENVWGTGYFPTSRAIDVRINQLRKKLGPYETWIKSLRGIGYRFEVDETA